MNRENLGDPRVWTAAVACLIAAAVVGRFAMPPRPPAVAAEAVAEIRYICRESGELFERPLDAASRIHPKTGKPTLVPAVYDAKRRQWKAGPPPEIMHRKGLLGPAS
ncbi:MAG: hypothetical protein EBX36_08110 [Planctomycetia bacterium]|nr:hypothetical protein [Planctomycetia bacterium]